MDVSPETLNATTSHHMLRNLVFPRPIALVSTINPQGLVSEVEPSGFHTGTSMIVKPPLVLESPAQMECKVNDIHVYGKDEGTHDFVIVEVVMFHVKDAFYHDALPDYLEMKILGRLGDDYYQGAAEPFVMKRLKYDEWQGRS